MTGTPVGTDQRASTTYYDRPVIKEPVWTWEVPAYFYAGGVAAGSALLAAVAGAIDGDDHEGLVRRARVVAAAGSLSGTGLLIMDLGRPGRFLNMLRVFKPSSPLNMGSWILSAAATFSAASVAFARRGPRLGDLAGLAAGAAALPLSSYTAVLLADTVVPVWQQSRRALPLLFAASSGSSAASILQMTAVTEHEAVTLRRFGTAMELAELVAGMALEREAGRVERVARPLEEGPSGTLWKSSKWLTIASLAVGAVAGRSRAGRIVGGVLGTAGSLALRYSVFLAGKASARDPRATFELQRASRK
ncbi:MAG: NrfD/PsrC family molybdoenzyme membrane anchor subunit [Actinomycetota bacterium]